MKYKYQLLGYLSVFFAGYCSSFLLPINSFRDHSPVSVYFDGLGEAWVGDENVNKNNYKYITHEAKKVSASNPQVMQSQVIISQPLVASVQSSVNAEEVGILQNELTMLRDYRLQAEIKKHNDYLQSRGGNSAIAMNNSFKNEPIDASWAKEKESLLNGLVDQSEHLSQMPHIASECRSKQCKLSVLSDDQFYLSKLSDSLGKIVTDYESSFASYSTVVDEASHTTIIYFDRN